MRKRLFFISLALALVLTTLAPAAALAAKPIDFGASGTITSISPGDVMPAGKSGRWRVIEREISGSLSGDINGSFVMAYKANVELATQAGNLHGTITVVGEDSYVFKVNGKIQPLEMVPTPFGFDLPKLTISGHWTFTDGARGQGDFEAWVIFIPTTEEDPEGPGHVKTIIANSFTMTGKWQP